MSVGFFKNVFIYVSGKTAGIRCFTCDGQSFDKDLPLYVCCTFVGAPLLLAFYLKNIPVLVFHLKNGDVLIKELYEETNSYP